LLVAANLAFDLDATWLSIPVAILTGLGVRMMVNTGGHASYLRGAITGVLALAAFLLGWWVTAQVAQSRANSASQPRAVQQASNATAAADDSAEEEADTEEPEETKAAPAPATRTASTATVQRPQVARGFQPIDFVWLCVAGLIAYELGRGTAGKTPVIAEETETEVPTGAHHPDA
jgi:hypothetical protein